MTDPDETLRARMDGDYQPPVAVEPAGGPIPPWRPPAAEPTDFPARKA